MNIIENILHVFLLKMIYPLIIALKMWKITILVWFVKSIDAEFIGTNWLPLLIYKSNFCCVYNLK